MYLSAPVTELNPQNEEPPTKQLRKEAMKDENYANVLPSARTISDFKEMQASKIETNVAIALIKKKRSVKITLHFDMTSLNDIDGEWSSINSRL